MLTFYCRPVQTLELCNILINDIKIYHNTGSGKVIMASIRFLVFSSIFSTRVILSLYSVPYLLHTRLLYIRPILHLHVFVAFSCLLYLNGSVGIKFNEITLLEFTSYVSTFVNAKIYHNAIVKI